MVRKTDKLIAENLKYFIKQLLGQYKVGGMVTIVIEVKRNLGDSINFISKVLILQIKTLESIIFLQKSRNKWKIIVTLRSMIGYNSGLPILFDDIIHNIITMGKISAEEIISEKQDKNLVKEFLKTYYSNNKIHFYFVQDQDQRSVVNMIHDQFVISSLNDNFKIFFFEREKWISNFIVFYKNNSYDYALINLLRFIFLKEKLSIEKNSIFKENDGNITFFMHIKDFKEQLPFMVNELLQYYSLELDSVNLNAILMENYKNIEEIFSNNFILPRK